MDIDLNILVDKNLLDLQDSSTTPEKALQSLMWFSPEAYTSEINFKICMSYFRYIATRQPDAFVSGIWEDITRQTLKYSRKWPYEYKFYDAASDEPQISTWLSESLSTHSKCPNPYIRLELYRLTIIFRMSLTSMNLEHIYTTFMHTICEIQPHHFYPSGNGDVILFSVTDLMYIIKNEKKIFNDMIKQFIKDREAFANSKEATFISQFIQLVGVFAVIAGCNPDYDTRIDYMQDCYQIFSFSVKCLDLIECLDHHHIPKQFRYVLSIPPFRRHTVETIRNITEAIINNTQLDRDWSRSMLISLDFLTRDLHICTKNCNIPRLLLSRQVHGGPTRIHKQFLLLRNLDPMSRDNSDELNVFTEESEEVNIFTEIVELRNYFREEYENSLNNSNSEASDSTSSSNNSDSDDGEWTSCSSNNSDSEDGESTSSSNSELDTLVEASKIH